MKFKRIQTILVGGAVLMILAAGQASAQAGRGTARIGGVVVDVEGNPVADACVVIEFAADPSVKKDMASGKKGDWAFIGLATGNWNLTVTADGFSR